MGALVELAVPEASLWLVVLLFHVTNGQFSSNLCYMDSQQCWQMSRAGASVACRVSGVGK